jgi:ribulose 1,5-bisphosphate synthetase/thiazole synthase
MNRKILVLVMTFMVTLNIYAVDYDICIYGGSSSGIIAAHAAAQMGKKVLVVEPSKHLGGLTTGGLGYTDIGNKQVVVGLSKQFYRKLGKHYGSLEQWVFEPSIAKRILMDYLRHPNISILANTRLVSVDKKDGRIQNLNLMPELGKKIIIKAKYFIDCSCIYQSLITLVDKQTCKFMS